MSLGNEATRAPCQRAGALTLRIERKHGLDSDINSAKLVSLEHDLSHLLTVGLWVHGRLSEEDLASARVRLELVVKRVVPEVLHVVPVLDDAVLHWVRHLEEGAVLGRLVTDHQVLELRAAQALLGTQDWTADDRREDWGQRCAARRG